jgi:hypothetical protein
VNFNYLQSNGEHNHLREPEDIEVQRFRHALKERVVNETVPISKIYDEEISKAKFSSEVLASVPMIREIRKSGFSKSWGNPFIFLEPGLNQARRKLTPSLPGSTSFDIPDSYHTTSTGEKFLASDTLIGRKRRMLIFASPSQLELLFNASTIFMDGTFSASPPFFDQVYTIHAAKFDSSMTYAQNHERPIRSNVFFSALPCVFGLLPDRKKSTYHVFFEELKGLAVSMGRLWKPERIITDFETSLIPLIATEVIISVHLLWKTFFGPLVVPGLSTSRMLLSSQSSNIPTYPEFGSKHGVQRRRRNPWLLS